MSDDAKITANVDESGLPRNRGRLSLISNAIYVGLTLFGVYVFRKQDFAFPNFVFGDIGGSWRAVDLIRQGKLPGVDYAYQYGAFSIGLFDLGLRVLGDVPMGCWLFCLICTIILAGLALRFASLVKATPAAWILASCWVIASQRILFLSSAHALEPVMLAAAVVTAAAGRPEVALLWCVVGWFVKPSMALVLGAAFFCWKLLDASSFRDALRLAGRMTLHAALTAAICLAVSVAWLGPRSAFSMMIPNQGVEVYKALNFGFFRGSGSQIWYMPGASFGYYFGTVSASWLTINAGLLLLAVVVSVRWIACKARDHAFRDRTGELLVILVAAHSAFVCLFYGTAWTWAYYGWLFWMAMLTGMTWASRHCPWPRLVTVAGIALAALSLMGNFANFSRTSDSFRRDIVIDERSGLYSSPEFAAAWRAVEGKMNDSPALVSIHFGNGEGILGPPFFSPPFWCIAPGDSFAPMFEAWARSIDRAGQIVQYLPDNLERFPEVQARIDREFTAETLPINSWSKLIYRRRIENRPNDGG